MEIKFRIKQSHGLTRVEQKAKIKEIMINEDILHPEKESVAIGFVQDQSSGIIEFSMKEINAIIKAVKAKQHFIKGIKVFKE